MSHETKSTLRAVLGLLTLGVAALLMLAALLTFLVTQANGDLTIDTSPLRINGQQPAVVHFERFTSPEVFEAEFRIGPNDPPQYISCDGRYGGYPCVCRPTGQVQYYNPQTGENLDLGFNRYAASVFVNGTGIRIVEGTLRQEPADFNGDGLVTLEDIYAFLDAYFEGTTRWELLDFLKAWFDGAAT